MDTKKEPTTNNSDIESMRPSVRPSTIRQIELAPHPPELTRGNVYYDTSNLEDVVPNRYYTFCLGHQTDRKLLFFSVQVIISIFVLGFSFYKLSQTKECPTCEDTGAVYISLISSVLAYYIGSRTG